MNSANKMHKGALPLSSVNKSHYGTKFFFGCFFKKKKGGGGRRLFPVFHIQCSVQTGSDSEAPSQMHLIQCQNSSHEFENNTGVTNLCMLVSPICQS